MQIAILAAGFAPGEADGLRRAMAAWKRKGGLAQYYDRIVDGMTSRGYEKLTLPLKNVSLAEWLNSGKENGNDKDIKGARPARIQARCSGGGHFDFKGRRILRHLGFFRCPLPTMKPSIAAFL